MTKEQQYYQNIQSMLLSFFTGVFDILFEDQIDYYSIKSKMTLPIPMHSQKRMIQRMNRTLGGQSKITLAHSIAPQKGKLAVLKKIFTISSIKQQVKKIFLKFLQIGSKALTEQNNQKILNYSRSILDNDRQKQLGEHLNDLANEEVDPALTLFKIVNELVISPVEKSYITKIEKELKEDQFLQEEIVTIESQLTEEKAKRIRQYQSQKSGTSCSRIRVVKNTFQEVQNFENKLMRANQKLNQLSSNNNKLRDKINQLRKQKNAMEDIYSKLKYELQSKKQNVQKTIKFAGDAYCSRNKAQQDLRTLKQQSQLRKQQFRTQCQKLNSEIQHDLRFKQFIKSKEMERQQLEKLQREVQENQSNIQLKKEENFRIDQEYKKSLQKEQQIRRCFQKIKKEIGYSEHGENKDLLAVFLSLYQKNIIMRDFVNQITNEVHTLEQRIETKKQEIQQMYLKGSADDYDRNKLNKDLQQKFDFHDKKKRILDVQYEKSVSTLHTIKKYLQDIFQEIAINPDLLDKLKNCSLNQENLTEFLGQLQKKGLQAISHYGKLVSEQLRAQKGAGWQIQKQIDELNNIITIQNANSMSNTSVARVSEYPSQLLIKAKEDKIKQEQLQKPLTAQDFKRYAIESLQQYQKKQIPKEKHLNKKYNIAPMLGKSKKK